MVATTPRSRTLSKSDYTLARTCDAKLFFRENGYPDNREYDPYLQLLAVGGYMVEALAKAKRPAGIRLEYGGNPAEDFERTREHLKKADVTLFEATLLSGRRLARADILERRGDTLHLIEVKSGSFDGSAHLASLAAKGKGEFRSSRKPYGVKGEWRSYIEDVTYQVLLLERVLPGVNVRPFLALVDTSKRSALDSVPSLFRILYKEGRDGTRRLHTGEYIGTAEQLAKLDLVTEVDVSEEVALLREEVELAAATLESLLDAPLSAFVTFRGAKCRDCEFSHPERSEGSAVAFSHPERSEGSAVAASISGFAECWGDLAHVKPHVLELSDIGHARHPSGLPLADVLVEQGKASLFDIPEHGLKKADGTIGPRAERQLRQIHCARSGECWVGPDLCDKIDALQYPIHFIDFEVSRLALPYHARMRPYGQVVFQWSSCALSAVSFAPNAQRTAHSPQHKEWLNTVDLWPNKKFAEALRAAIGDTGSVLTWSHYESSVLKEIVAELPQFEQRDQDLEDWIADVVDHRVVDLHEWARRDFYHPGMRGSTSIKVVLDALWKDDPIMREQFTTWTGLPASASEDPYAALPALLINGVDCDVREGTGAVRAYEAMMYGVEKDDQAAKDAWGALLKQYCKLDTVSMVLIFEHWRRAVALG